jgi:glycosyltransferase involved in cell wall biosynthesis
LPGHPKGLKSHKKKILFLVPYPLGLAPSQRFRFEQYFAALESAGFGLNVRCFFTASNWKIFYSPGRPIQKAMALFYGFARRVADLARLPGCDRVFIHREATPLGPPWFEWVTAKIFRKKIIYDFDDAIWLTDRAHETRLLKSLKWRSKVRAICTWSHKISCGNDFLKAYALRFNAGSVLNPTTVDTEHCHFRGQRRASKIKNEKEVIIGWTGSHSTLKYLNTIGPVLRQIEMQYPDVSFLVIADAPPDLNLQRLQFIPWNPATEMEDLLNIDIGIMPLPNEEWTKGKCGFKGLQYMALGIATVMSAVGVNPEIILHGHNGFLARSDDDWVTFLSRLIEQPNLRHDLGACGQHTVEQRYSVQSNTRNFLSLFE